MNPSNCTEKFPYDSVVAEYIHEMVAMNIMVILARNGNTFRLLGWNEYKKERKIDGDFSDKEREYFDVVVRHCSTEELARKFSIEWDM